MASEFNEEFLYHTPIMKKPIYYGSNNGSISFVGLMTIHVFFAFTTLGSIFIAFWSKKGGKYHILAGKIFVISMGILAITGIIIQIIRFTLYNNENDSIYNGLSRPSSYPDRIGFANEGIGTLAVLIQSIMGKNVTKLR